MIAKTFDINIDPWAGLLLSYTDSFGGRYILSDEVMEWLNEHNAKWYGIVTLPGDHNEGVSFEFQSEEDLILFKLTWQ